MARARGWRSALAVPMLRDGEPVGAIMVTRIESGRFESGSVELLQTFADQAVIALENVRGEEPGGRWFDVHVYDSGASRRVGPPSEDGSVSAPAE